MAAMVSVGKPVGHVEGPEKVGGRTKYTADLGLPDLLWGKCLRSPFPHARIVSLDVSRAKALPGVHAVITGADLTDVRIGKSILDMPVLARDKVRFVGERVAAVAADSPDIAEEALTLIEVQYEELPAVFDPLEAMRDDAPRVHDDPGSYETAPEPFQPPPLPVPPLPNVVSQVLLRHGDIEAGFAQADRIVEHTFFIPRVHQGYLEPHASIVRIGAEQRIDVWTTNKMPFSVRANLARAIGVPEERIRVHLMPVGGDFGGKALIMDTLLCYYLAERTGRPVKMAMTYTEELMAANPRHAATITLRTGVTGDGRITARRARAVFNCGAYGAFKPGMVNLPGIRAAGGPYRVPNLEIEGLMVYTNTVPGGYMRAPGGPQMVFAVESHTDMIAHELGLDPLEFRLRNVLEEGAEGSLGERYREVRCRETLLAAVHAAGWDSERAPKVGRGIAIHSGATRGYPSSARISIDAEARITMPAPFPDTGTGAYTVLHQIVAEELGVPLETIEIGTGDTDTAPYDAGVRASRVTYTAGRATVTAAQELKQALVRLAAQVLECAPQQVQFQSGRFITADGEELSLTQLMKQAAELGKAPITCSGSYVSAEMPDVITLCAQVAEVEVDLETGRVQLRRLVSAHDTGTIINPLTYQGQIEGGVVQGLGQALIEHLQVEDGAVTTLNLGDYKLPTIADIPALNTVFVKAEHGELPYEGKHIGEVGNVAVPAAIANAIYDAVGVRIMDLPLTAEKVYRALRAAGK